MAKKAKASGTKKTNAIVKTSVKKEVVTNGLSEALGFPGGLGFPGNQGVPWSEQLSNTDTLFVNLRWYFVSNLRQLLSELFVEIGLVQTIVDVPVDDGLKGGVKIKSKQLDEDQILKLRNSMDRDNDLNVIGQAGKWNRLFGGAGVIIMTDQDPETPLDLDAIGPDSPLEFRAVDMWELFWDKQNTEGYDPEIQSENFEHYMYYAKRLHKSRVMRLKGLTAPSFLRPRLRGWGFSVVEKLVRSINQYLKATDLGFEVMDEFKLDVFKIKNLTDALMSPTGSQKIRERVAMANWQKNYQNALVMDAEDEYDHKQLSFSGLAEAMEGIRMQVASDMRMPITKLFGTSMSKGFSTDQNDMEVYNSMVESEVRNKLKYHILRLIEIKCQKLFGFIPDDLSIEFAPLRELTAEQEENVKTQKFNRILSAKQAGLVTDFEFREACNKDNLLSITLDNVGDELNENDPDIAKLIAGEPDPKDTLDVQDPGANREDTRKPRAWETDTSKKEDIQNQLEAIEPYDLNQRMKRAIANSLAFDVASYEADGGDSIMPHGREKLFENPGKVDETLWKQCKDASLKAFGKIKYPFVVWLYKKRGGKFA